MNDRQYEQLKKAAEEECAKKIADAKAECKSRLDALAWQMRISGVSSASSSVVKRGRPGLVSDAVRQVIGKCPTPFVLSDVVTLLDASASDGHKHNRISVSSVLTQMANDNEIVLVEKGAGKRPSKYTRKETAEQTAKID